MYTALAAHPRASPDNALCGRNIASRFRRTADPAMSTRFHLQPTADNPATPSLPTFVR